MDNIESSPDVESILDQPVIDVPMSSLLVSFRFSGRDNGVFKEGFDSRVIGAPVGVQVTSAEDVKAIADTLASSEFLNGRKFEGLEIVLMHITRLPI